MGKRRRGSNTGIPGLSFSWSRALGLASAKWNLSRQIGVPLTRGGRQRKIGRYAGCCWIVLCPFGIASLGLLFAMIG